MAADQLFDNRLPWFLGEKVKKISLQIVDLLQVGPDPA